MDQAPTKENAAPKPPIQARSATPAATHPRRPIQARWSSSKAWAKTSAITNSKSPNEFDGRAEKPTKSHANRILAGRLLSDRALVARLPKFAAPHFSPLR